MKREILTVLVLEPNALQRELIKVTLIRNRMNPIICDQPNDLRQHLVQYLPDVLLIDTYLPGQNGLDLVGELQSDVLLKRTKIFFLSSMGFPEIVQKAGQVGASGFLVKPLNPDLLVRRILNCFDRQENAVIEYQRV
ncbi:MAG TPA: response regulator [Anaerolineales bacterium]|nr:response regulator [Anaerolineales bacterium]